MKKLIFAAGFILALTGCEAGEDNNPANKPLEDITDLSYCNGSSPSTIEGTWIIHQKQGDLLLQSSLKIEKNRTTASNQCRMKGKYLVVQATTSSRYSSMTLEILGSAQKRQSVNEPQVQFECAVEMNPGQFQYRFNGRCLVLDTPEATTTFLPSI